MCKNLPALPQDYTSFIPATKNMPTLQTPAGLEVSAEDFDGYEEPKTSLPIVTIRQKDLKDEKGKTIRSAGGWRFKDSIFDATADVDGDTGIEVHVLIDEVCRTYWLEGNSDKPSCKSRGGKVGVGVPGGSCRECSLCRFGKDGTRPRCTEGRRLLVLDPHMKSCYVVQLPPSAIRPYDDYKRLIRELNKDLPPFMTKTRITLEYVTEAKHPYYRPVFTPNGVGDKALFDEMRKLRAELRDAFEQTEMEGESDDERTVVDAEAEVGDDLGLPDGVTPVRQDGDDTLPF